MSKKIAPSLLLGICTFLPISDILVFVISRTQFSELGLCTEVNLKTNKFYLLISCQTNEILYEENVTKTCA